MGFCASSISVAAAMYLHFRMYNRQQKILEEARIEAQSANKAKSAFLANMSHEIRTPINVMQGQIDIKVSKDEEETKLIFEVKDTGIGIKEENLPVLFDAFTRVDSKKNEKTSDEKITKAAWKEQDERKRRSFVAPQAKILVVDDNPENLMVVRSLLKRTAVFVDTADSREECIDKVRHNAYDLILLDYMMPQVDGIDTIRELKKDVRFHIPVIALSADVTKGIEQTFLREDLVFFS